MKHKFKCDVLILGAGIIGLSIGKALLESNPALKVIITEKESTISKHASGRNSGVLHAGFYYSPDSLKAKFCREGNLELRKLAQRHKIPIREVGKVVVARSLEENNRLDSLYERGITNGVQLEIHPAKKLKDFEPLASTYERFIWSPTTAVSDSRAINNALKEEFEIMGGLIHYETKITLEKIGEEITDASQTYDAKHFVNSAGAQADRISRKVGIGTDYAMLPIMGIYRATEEKNLPLRTLVYPVPHPINPFLGVHFTLTIDGLVKIGPTAIPIAGREQYSLRNGWSVSDVFQSIKGMTSLIRGESHNFGPMLRSEWPKVFEYLLIKESAELVPTSRQVTNWYRKPPGIRAQLVHLPTGKLVQDFIVESDNNATHVLNAVSPGWTSAIPFGRWISNSII